MKLIDKNVMSISTTEPSKVDILTQIHLFIGHTKLKGININNFDVIISVSSSLVAHTVGKMLIIYIKKCLMSGTKRKCQVVHLIDIKIHQLHIPNWKGTDSNHLTFFESSFI